LKGEWLKFFYPTFYKQFVDSADSVDSIWRPPHFFGELAKTSAGVEILNASGHIKDFLQLYKDETINPVERRAALWTLGHISSSRIGANLLDKEKLFSEFVRMATSDSCLSIRGTCFYILGMVSKAHRDTLDKLDWDSPNNSYIAVPRNPKLLFQQLPEHKFEGSFAISGEPINYPKDKNETRQEILTTVCSLSNFISAESASRTLKRIKSRAPQHFSSPSLVLEVSKLLGSYKFRLPVRRFIYEIFDGFEIKEALLEELDQLP